MLQEFLGNENLPEAERQRCERAQVRSPNFIGSGFILSFYVQTRVVALRERLHRQEWALVDPGLGSGDSDGEPWVDPTPSPTHGSIWPTEEELIYVSLQLIPQAVGSAVMSPVTVPSPALLPPHNPIPGPSSHFVADTPLLQLPSPNHVPSITPGGGSALHVPPCFHCRQASFKCVPTTCGKHRYACLHCKNDKRRCTLNDAPNIAASTSAGSTKPSSSTPVFPTVSLTPSTSQSSKNSGPAPTPASASIPSDCIPGPSRTKRKASTNPDGHPSHAHPTPAPAKHLTVMLTTAQALFHNELMALDSLINSILFLHKQAQRSIRRMEQMSLLEDQGPVREYKVLRKRDPGHDDAIMNWFRESRMGRFPYELPDIYLLMESDDY